MPDGPGGPWVPITSLVPLIPAGPAGPSGLGGPCVSVLLFLLSSSLNLNIQNSTELTKNLQMYLFYTHIFCQLLNMYYNCCHHIRTIVAMLLRNRTTANITNELARSPKIKTDLCMI